MNTRFSVLKPALTIEPTPAAEAAPRLARAWRPRALHAPGSWTCGVSADPAQAGRGHARRRGFTLLEMLIALALGALVLLAMNTFVFSMGDLWGRNQGKRFFDLHVRAVTRFLGEELRRAAWPPAGQAGTPAIAIQEMRTEAGLAEPVLAFDLPSGNRLLNWPGPALPDLACGLVVRDRRGLVLLWHSRLETRFAEQNPRECVVTPLVTAMAYDYYDENFKRWQTETTPRRGQGGTYDAPGRLRLTFTYDGQNQDVVLALPVAQEGLPAW